MVRDKLKEIHIFETIWKNLEVLVKHSLQDDNKNKIYYLLLRFSLIHGVGQSTSVIHRLYLKFGRCPTFDFPSRRSDLRLSLSFSLSLARSHQSSTTT